MRQERNANTDMIVSWAGVYSNTARSPQKTWYGPSSLIYFISRMDHFLNVSFRQPGSEGSMQLKSASKVLDGIHDGPKGNQDGRQAEAFRGPKEPSRHESELVKGTQSTDSHSAVTCTEDLTPTQEEYFLNLYWQSYHTSMPILDETEFRAHYKSLWIPSRKHRKPSALVDIVVALCMQYGTAIQPAQFGEAQVASRDGETEFSSDDSTIAGRWHYRRCQALMASELESPSLSTLQCHILTVIYLCCASFQNMADSTLAKATRTATMLGLHHEPAADLPQNEREQRNRVWWYLCVLESKTSMKLGRPFLLDLDRATCGLPKDSHEVGGSSFASPGDSTTWLTFNLLNTKLVLAARSVYTPFYRNRLSYVKKGADTPAPTLTGETVNITVFDEPQVLDIHAQLFETHMRALKKWVSEVPSTLKTKRKNGGEALSTDLSPLEIEKFAPTWLKRQRLLLELLYHNLSLSLYRPFISFVPVPPSPPSLQTPLSALSSASVSSTKHGYATVHPPVSNAHADSAARHAMALTHIMHQVLRSTDLLAGWNESFQWQWNAALTLVGYLLATHHRRGEVPADSALPASPASLTPNLSARSSPLPQASGMNKGKSTTAVLAREALNLCVEVMDIFASNFAVASSAAHVLRELRSKVDSMREQQQRAGTSYSPQRQAAHPPAQQQPPAALHPSLRQGPARMRRESLRSGFRQLGPDAASRPRLAHIDTSSEIALDSASSTIFVDTTDQGHPAGPPYDHAPSSAGSIWVDKDEEFASGDMWMLGGERNHDEVRKATISYNAPSLQTLEQQQQQQPAGDCFLTSMDMALAVDSFNSLEMLQPRTNHFEFNDEWFSMNL